MRIFFELKGKKKKKKKKKKFPAWLLHIQSPLSLGREGRQQPLQHCWRTALAPMCTSTYNTQIPMQIIAAYRESWVGLVDDRGWVLLLSIDCLGLPSIWNKCTDYTYEYVHT